MATSPSQTQVDWAQSIKPLISASYSSFNRDYIVDLVEVIIKCEAEILEHEEKYETFFSLLVALSAHYLTAAAAQIGKYSASRIGQACEVVLRFLLKRIKMQSQNSNIVHISQGHMMVLIQSLCTGKVGLSKSDILTFTALLKSAQTPPGSAVSETEDSPTESSELDSPTFRNKETRIFDQMMAILDDSPNNAAQRVDRTPTQNTNAENDVSLANGSDVSNQTIKTFADRNISLLQSLGGSDVLLDLCEHLVFLMRHMTHSQDALQERAYFLPTNLSDATFTRNSYQSLLSDISIVWRIMSLPVHEPLTPARLQKIVSVVVTCLYAAVTVATANTVVALSPSAQTKMANALKDEEVDNYAASIVEKSLDIYNNAVHAMRTSSRAGGQAVQNAATLGAWVILTGLKHLLAITPPAGATDKPRDRTKSSSSDTAPAPSSDSSATSRPSSSKSSSSFNVLAAALGGHAIGLLKSLMVDIQLETHQVGGTVEDCPVAMIDMLHQFSAGQRISWLTKRLSVLDLLFTLLNSTLKKALSLKKVRNMNPSSADQDEISSTGSASDSTTYYEDDFSSSDESSADDDDDSEPIFGQWFEESLSPQEAAAETPTTTASEPLDFSKTGYSQAEKLTSPTTSNLMPDKKDPEGFVSLATMVLQLLTEHFLCSNHKNITSYIRTNLGEHHMTGLAAILKDLDKEHLRLHQDKHYGEFSFALVHFCHHFVSSGLVSDKLQDLLLSNLGVDLHSSGAWPLNVQPRTLALLAEILLLRQQKEREISAPSATTTTTQLQGSSEVAVINIWQRFLKSLSHTISKFSNSAEAYEDVNVEHMQLLIFLYHSLRMWQRKTILLEVASCLITVTQNMNKKLREVVPLPMSRLLLLFEYLIHYFYDPKDQLLHQVRWNLFGAPSNPGQTDKEDSLTKTHFPFHEVEDSYQKNLQAQHPKEVSMKPYFYNLAPIDNNNQDAPKIDGLACRILLGHPDCLSYDKLYAACVQMLSAGSECAGPFSLLDASSVQYHFIITSRLLDCLPPSASYVQTLESNQKLPSHAFLLQTLRWLPRISHKVFAPWTKDGLVMQKMSAQRADGSLAAIEELNSSVAHDVLVALQFMQDQIGGLSFSDGGDLAPTSKLPSLWTVCLLDSVIAKVHVALDDHFTRTMSDSAPHKQVDKSEQLLSVTFRLIQAYTAYIRLSVMSQIEPSDQCPATPEAMRMYTVIMSLGSSLAVKVCHLGKAVMDLLPAPVTAVLEKWNNNNANEFPRVGAWRNAFANDILPVEGYVEAIQSAHMSALSNHHTSVLSSSLKHVLQALVRLAGDLTMWCPNEKNTQLIQQSLLPVALDVTTECVSDAVTSCMEHINMPLDSGYFQVQAWGYVLHCTHQLLTTHATPDSGVDEHVLLECVSFLESTLDNSVSKVALGHFYTQKADLVSVLLSAASDHLSLSYSTTVLKFFNRLFELMEKNPSDKEYLALCTSLSKLAKIDVASLQGWLSKMIMTSGQSLKDTAKLVENRQLLQSLTGYIVKETSFVGEEVATAILNSLIPMGSQLLSSTNDGVGFSELMVVMATLAGSGTGSGHLCLFDAAVDWFEQCKKFLVQKNVIEKLEDSISEGKHQVIMEACCYIMSYIGEILGALKYASDRHSSISPLYDAEAQTQEMDSDWIEELGQDEDDSAAEDSDEESLNNKLCTFTITQKEFMNQHWYHCHTCKMVDGVGVCTVCARVCHKDHDLSYAKYGSFFCDCGAKEDGSCQALVRRSPQSGLDHSGPSASVTAPSMPDTIIPSSLHRHLSPLNTDRSGDNVKATERVSKSKELLGKQLQPYRDMFIRSAEKSKTVESILDLLHSLMPPIMGSYTRTSPLNVSCRVTKAMTDLHTLSKTLDNTDQLMIATLGSQEGAFENVRMNYNGDQGQTIRQLITSHVLRRVAMCCLTSPHGKRQHLAVTHEKGKITILQLSALLKQADSSKRKLTLTRLSSAPVPFTVLSITGNPCNEDVLAVCGLKDCHVLTLSGAGAVNDRLVLHPALDTGNFIIKALWLPGSQTELALVTADFVKVYDLSQDAISPQYYFLLPSGKVRDATFVFGEDSRHLVLMASTGFLYVQTMEEQSSATHGPFYITNVLDVRHSDIKESYGQIGGGGVSVYYSHSLQLLFYSYTQGKTFISPIGKKLDSIDIGFPVVYKSSNGGKSSAGPQPLVQWSEVPGHPGLVTSMTQTSNNPVVLMVKPDTVYIQEIKVLPAKAKIQDMVAIRHAGSNSEQRTTLILLCEDGSLRIYMANTDTTGHWLSPLLQPYPAINVLKPVRKKKASKSDRPAGIVSFPIDFFEHCQLSSDVEYGGNDILQIYNVQQIKHRLNTTGMYIACTKPVPFSIEISNTNTSQVMVGLRVLVGTQAMDRAPSFLEVFGRTVQVNLTRARWFDIPFTRDESLTADKKVTLTVGTSVDPTGVTVIDSIKVYTKSKDAFGWLEDNEELSESSGSKVSTSSVTVGNGHDSDGPLTTQIPPTTMDKLLSSSLEVLDGCYSLSNEEKMVSKQASLELATELLTLSTPNTVQTHTKSLMASLHSSRQAYYSHKDQAVLKYVLQCLAEDRDKMDAFAFQHLLIMVRAIAVARPGHLVQYIDGASAGVLELTDIENGEDEAGSSRGHLVEQLMEVFWRLHTSRPVNATLAPLSVLGLSHIELTVGALVEIIHAFSTSDQDYVNMAARHYVRLLLCKDVSVSFSSKQAMIRMLRTRQPKRSATAPSPQRCSTPGAGAKEETDGAKPATMETAAPPVPANQPAPIPPPDNQYEIVEPGEPMLLEPGEPVGQPSPLEALLAGGAHFPPVLDIPPDADDETMVELAIALSLQEQQEGPSGALAIQGLHLSPQSRSGASLEAVTYSDTTASAPGSDDEVGSTAATDGSTLRTSPAEQVGSAGSESGSVIDSDHNASGRSSAYGDILQDNTVISTGHNESGVLSMQTPGLPQQTHAEDTQPDSALRLHSLRLALLGRLMLHMSEVCTVDGVTSIPFMQVLLMLISDLDSEEKDKASLDKLLSTLLAELDLSHAAVSSVKERTANGEVQLVILRLVSVLMSRTKTSSKSSETSSLLSMSTASALLGSGVIEYCLAVLKNLENYWKGISLEKQDSSGVTGQLLKLHQPALIPDMSPFFLRQYVKGHAGDVFQAYPQLLTEMVLRLPYQIKKIAESTPGMAPPTFDQDWFHCLCEYLMMPQTTFVKRQVRKLLQFLCGSKERYRQLRDIHALDAHVSCVRRISDEAGLESSESGYSRQISLSYTMLITLIEQLKACADIAVSRTLNWQRFCLKDDSILPFLVHSAIVLDDSVAPVILQLLQCALCGLKAATHAQATGGATASPSKAKREKSKSKAEGDSDESLKHDEALCSTLTQQLLSSVPRDMLRSFIQTFLLNSNSTAVRWQGHALLLHIYRNSGAGQQELLLDMMWTLWPSLSSYGRKAPQFVDLLGYFTLKTPLSSDKKMKQYVEGVVTMLRTQNHLLANHSNTTIYNQLQNLVEFDGYYLESDPCFVCNNPEVAYGNIKLSAIKVDSKFTTNTQIVKLVGSHNIASITIRISDIKRTKMVRTINFYYNNRSVQAVVELKNKPGLWHKAKKVTLCAGQTETRVEFPLPIVACNLLIEYADFCDNLNASAETLQCPRCSAAVPANPGVCSNCGENVFQCHKCRSINYDEKDPFLCNACGFCKYAKFEYTLTAKQCCAVDPIENDEDRKKAVSTINSLLEKADRLYRQLQLHRTNLDALLIRSNENVLEKAAEDTASSSAQTVTVRKCIQQVAQRYCGDCKATFDELSKIIQRVVVSRQELVQYDRQQREAVMAALPAGSKTDTAATSSGPRFLGRAYEAPHSTTLPVYRSHSQCYGCASSVVEHCTTLLRALASNMNIRQILCAEGLLQDLLDYNLRPCVPSDVRHLLCLLTKDNQAATQLLNMLLMKRINTALRTHNNTADLSKAVQNDMLLLAYMVHRDDSCWEQRLQCVVKLLLKAMKLQGPVITETITLPCLRMLQHIMKPAAPASKKHKDKTVDSLTSVSTSLPELHVDFNQWLTGSTEAVFRSWKSSMPSKAVDLTSRKKKEERVRDRDIERHVIRVKYLMEKYGTRWRLKTLQRSNIGVNLSLQLTNADWLRKMLFCPWSRAARQVACNMVEAVCQLPTRCQHLLDMLTDCLDELGKNGEDAVEFLTLYKKLITPAHCKYYLALKGVMPKIGTLITQEIEQLAVLEDTTLTSDLSQGFALKALTELLAQFVEHENIKRHYKNCLVGVVLNGYLSLRKLLVQRTKLIDSTQDKLLQLLGELTTGTESETRDFMAVCVETVKKYGLDDFRSPVFIFERLCSIIYPEENDVGEFFMSLEKDPQQEDFLQGRMLGNPYSSLEPGLGPLMRDVKNKICQDCELVALLEDDTGMEILVCNKIISLDLPVKDVYKKIWVTEHGEGEAMRMVYRMRGLLGDATEDMINSLDSAKDEDIDNEEVYKMATVMAECGGLTVMLQRLAAVGNLATGRSLLTVLLKLFSFCVKVKVNRLQLIKPEMNTINIMLAALNLALLAEQESGTSSKGQSLTEQILQIMETILLEASSAPLDEYKEFSKLCGDCEQLMMLLDRINSPFVRSSASVLQALMRLIPFLAFGDEEKMLTLINHFKQYCDFNRYDVEHTDDDKIHLDCFCVIADGIEQNANGQRLKDMILQQGIVEDALKYMKTHAPVVKTLLATDSEDWKEFITKPALRYVLRLLCGLSKGHQNTQTQVGKDMIPILHKLEQASSDEYVGTAAENLMEALRGNSVVAAKIEEIRQETKLEKKKLAMAMRQKQLGALGMTTNEKGQVTVKSPTMQHMEELKEEMGLTCVICREGYRYQPTKVLGIYTYTSRMDLDEFEAKHRKMQGYSTVSHFNIVHVDCHLAAVRHARGREEWQSAELQNANTKCNGLLPLWGPQVPESAFATCLARHNTYLQECTGLRDTSYAYTVHDVKLLLLRFAQEKSFSEQSGGGGRQSNMHLVPYLMHMAVYVMNTTRSVSREEKNLQLFIDTPPDKWVDNSYEVDGPLYWLTMTAHICSKDKWQQYSVMLLRRLVAMAHVRHVAPSGPGKLTDKAIKPFTIYRTPLLLFAIVNGLYQCLYKKVSIAADSSWALSLADFIRHSDASLLEEGDKLVKSLEEEVLPCESFAEYCDVVGMLDKIPNPENFITETLAMIP